MRQKLMRWGRIATNSPELHNPDSVGTDWWRGRGTRIASFDWSIKCILCTKVTNISANLTYPNQHDIYRIVMPFGVVPSPPPPSVVYLDSTGPHYFDISLTSLIRVSECCTPWAATFLVAINRSISFSTTEDVTLMFQPLWKYNYTCRYWQ